MPSDRLSVRGPFVSVGELFIMSQARKKNSIGFPPGLLGDAPLRMPVIGEAEGWIAVEKPAGVGVREYPWDAGVPDMDTALNKQLQAEKPELVKRGATLFGSAYYLDPAISGVALFAKNRDCLTELKNLVGSAELRFRFFFVTKARAAGGAKAVVDLDHCNGCGICLDDCPFDAITLQARSDGARYEHEVAVNSSLCAACGICAGSCPASNPFRSSREILKTGIDMPQLPVDEIRRLTRETIEAMQSDLKIIVFGCEHGLNVERLNTSEIRGLRLLCSGMLPPTMVEYALKQGANGVMVTGCRHNDCYFRFGNRWTKMRFDGVRKPILRARAERERIRICGAAEPDLQDIGSELDAFRQTLLELDQAVEIAVTTDAEDTS